MTISGWVPGTMANGSSEPNYKNRYTTEKVESTFMPGNRFLLKEPVRLVSPRVDMGDH